ncbi:MAG: hypothetical protein ABIS36_13560 [Chryseolinea sp.]
MKNRISATFFLPLLFAAFESLCQPATLDVAGAGIGGGSVKYNDPSAIGNKKAPALEYSDVRGKYMWDNEWHPGLLVFKNGHGIKLQQVRLNLYTQDVQYLAKDGTEMAAEKGLVKGLLLYSSKDTTKTIGTFRIFKVTDSKTEQFFEQMNQGKVLLFKRSVTSLKKLPYDPSIGKTEYRFFATIDHYIQDGADLRPLSSLNKTSVASVIKIDEAADDWLGKNKNKLKTEEDVMTFLNYLNAR